MTRRERVRRFVDGELDSEDENALWEEAKRDPALAALIADAEVVSRALTELEPDGVPVPPNDLVDGAVLRAVQRRAAEAESPRPFWAQLLRPRTVRLRLAPAGALLAVGAVALVAFLVIGGAGERAVPPPAATETAAAPRAAVRLMLEAEGARSVAIAGDFNGWTTDRDHLEDPDGDGLFVGTLRLPAGTYAYMFVIDGGQWVTDPYASNHADDGFGSRNAVLRVD